MPRAGPLSLPLLPAESLLALGSGVLVVVIF